MSRKDGQEIFDLARSKNLFAVEGIQTGYFPAAQKCRSLLEKGEIGTPDVMISHIGFPVDLDRKNRVTDLSSAPGGLAEIGCYLISAAPWFFGVRPPNKVHVVGMKSPEGIDTGATITLSFENPNAMAVLVYSLNSLIPDTTVFSGSKGSLRLKNSGHLPRELEVTRITNEGVAETDTKTFTIPKVGGSEPHFLMPHSEGFMYEIECTLDCLDARELQSCTRTQEETLWELEIMDKVRDYLGVKTTGERTDPENLRDRPLHESGYDRYDRSKYDDALDRPRREDVLNQPRHEGLLDKVKAKAGHALGTKPETKPETAA